MADLTTKPAELHFTLEIKRASGEVEVVQMVGHITSEEEQNGSDTLNSGS